MTQPLERLKSFLYVSEIIVLYISLYINIFVVKKETMFLEN